MSWHFVSHFCVPFLCPISQSWWSSVQLIYSYYHYPDKMVLIDEHTFISIKKFSYGTREQVCLKLHSNGITYSSVDQVKFVGRINSNFWKAVCHKFDLFHAWILWFSCTMICQRKLSVTFHKIFDLVLFNF